MKMMKEKRLRGIRGATIAPADTAEAILEATGELLSRIAAENALNPLEDIVSIIFTSTPDLHGEFPAKAARMIGWGDLPLLGAMEMERPGAPERCIRVLIHAYSERERDEIKHIYTRGAEVLRPDR